MKTLYLVRHAKSSWTNANQSDHDRPLNERGERDAPRMGKRLGRRTPQPEMIISSSAVRARTTAKILAKAINFSKSDITINQKLYGAEPEDVVSILCGLDDAVDCIMVVGHNPTFTHLVNDLGNVPIDNMPTCGMAVLTFNVEAWKDIGYGKGKLVDFDYPKREAD